MDIYYGAHKFELSQKLVWEQARGEATVQPEWDNLEEHCRFREQLSKVQGEEDFKGFLRGFFCQKLVKKQQKSCSQDISSILECHKNQHSRKGTLVG